MPEDSDDFQTLLIQERARIGQNEVRRKARRIAREEYREFHANSPILIGTSKQGYQLTEEAQAKVVEYLAEYAEFKTKTIIIYNFISGTKAISEVEAVAINNFIAQLPGWKKIFILSDNDSTNRIFNMPRYQTWERVCEVCEIE